MMETREKFLNREEKEHDSGIKGKSKVILSLLNEDEDMKAKVLENFRVLTNVLVRDYSARSGSLPISTFESYSLPKGCVLLRNSLSPREQFFWAKECLEKYAYYPYSNISALSEEVSSNLKQNRDAYFAKLRWTNLGYNFDWTNRKYHPGWKSDFPESLSDLCKSLAVKSGFDQDTYYPDAAIVNFSQRKSTFILPHNVQLQTNSG